jgi:hypothetical protein
MIIVKPVGLISGSLTVTFPPLHDEPVVRVKPGGGLNLFYIRDIDGYYQKKTNETDPLKHSGKPRRWMKN